MPAFHVGIIKDRSSIANRGIYIHSGVVDEDFRGTIKAHMYNSTKEAIQFYKGERICQILIMKYEDFEINEGKISEETKRGEKGLGSTGK